MVAAASELAKTGVLTCRWIANPGVPPWWPIFCLAYDVTAGGYLAVLLARSRVAARVTE